MDGSKSSKRDPLFLLSPSMSTSYLDRSRLLGMGLSQNAALRAVLLLAFLIGRNFLQSKQRAVQLTAARIVEATLQRKPATGKCGCGLR